ncbi:hypothetical protein L1277_000438 [Okibacterium sp. HSC-33S16]|uniref:GIY-YIG nuclease family protein n=1 Tax=Okibacterium sp. HSC-33S16 TaxID=2910965 RepID=UPI00209F8D0C|nr:GIY-YIG nuclease family protein [Okibacterium sp. HSC-33S16]MCP2030374.1 hypothetical protein [Okibacterium sp. HSC-33S16]
MSSPAKTCSIEDTRGGRCGLPAEAQAPLSVCSHHLALASQWADREYGVTDALESPCIACGSRLGVRYPSGWLCAVCEWKVGDFPDAEVISARVDVVYYLRFDDRIKIGTSSNPRSRLGNIVHDELLGFELGGRQLERRRHTQFASHRLHSSEWFAVHDALLRHIGVVTAGVDDPWLLYKRWVSEKIALQG